MTPIVFTLPFPPKTLSPNARHGHAWAQLRRAQKAYAKTCWALTRHQRVPKPTAAKLDVRMLFVTARTSYDADGLSSRMKAGLDGVAEAWGINDRAFARVSSELDERRDDEEAHVHLIVTEFVPAVRP